MRNKHGITKQQMQEIKRTKRVDAFSKYLKDNNLGMGISEILYATRNTNEFLAMAFSSPQVHAAMKDIKLPNASKASTGAIQNLCDFFVNIVGKTLGLPDNAYTMLDEVLLTTSHIAENLSNPVLEGRPNLTNSNIDDAAPTTMAQRMAAVSKAPRKGTFRGGLGKFGTGAKQLAKKYGQSVSETIRKIDPAFLTPLRKMEMKISRANREMQVAVKPFIDAYRDLSKGDKSKLDLMLINRDDPEYKVELEKFLKKNPKMAAGLKAADNVLAEIYDNAEKNGMNPYGAKKEYFPRRVIEVQALMQAIQDDPEYGALQADTGWT